MNHDDTVYWPLDPDDADLVAEALVAFVEEGLWTDPERAERLGQLRRHLEMETAKVNRAAERRLLGQATSAGVGQGGTGPIPAAVAADGEVQPSPGTHALPLINPGYFR